MQKKKAIQGGVLAVILGLAYFSWPQRKKVPMAKIGKGVAIFTHERQNLWKVHSDLPQFGVVKAELVDFKGVARPVSNLHQQKHLSGQVEGPINGRILRLVGDSKVLESAVYLHE